MKKTICVLSFIFLFATSLIAQKTTERKSYYDYLELKVRRVWYELGDGTFHGTTRYYTENGDLSWTKTYDYGKPVNYKLYYSDGSVRVETNYNKNNQYHGEQLHYRFENGKRFLSDKAVIENNAIKSAESYYSEGKIRFKYLDDGSQKVFKHYKKDGSLYATISEINGKISNFNAYRITFQDGNFGNIDNRNFKLNIVQNTYQVNIINTDYYGDLLGSVEGNFIIPENQHFSIDAQFSYNVDANHTLHFDINISLIEGDKFKLEVSNITDLDDYETYKYAFNPIKDYLNHLDLDGLYVKIDSKKIKKEEMFENGKVIWTKKYWSNGNLRFSNEGGINRNYNEKGELIK